MKKIAFILLLLMGVNSVVLNAKPLNRFHQLKQSLDLCIKKEDEAHKKAVKLIEQALPKLALPYKEQAYLLRAYHRGMDLQGQVYSNPTVLDSFYLVKKDLLKAFNEPKALEQIGKDSSTLNLTFTILSSFPFAWNEKKEDNPMSLGLDLAERMGKILPEVYASWALLFYEMGLSRGIILPEAYTDSLYKLLSFPTSPLQKAPIWAALAEAYQYTHPDSAYKYIHLSIGADSLSKAALKAIEWRKNFLEPTYSLKGQEIYSPDSLLLWTLRCKNISTLPYTLYKVPQHQGFNLLLGMWDYTEFIEQADSLFAGRWCLDSLPIDYAEHELSVSTPALPAGIYLIKAGEDVFLCFQVSTLSFIEAGEKGISVHRESGAPIPQVTIRAFAPRYNYESHLNNYIEVGHLFSDKDGFLNLPQGDSLEEEGRVYAFYTRVDSLLIPYRKYGPFGLLRNRQKPKKDTTFAIHYFTHQPIYHPGDSVKIKGVAWAYPPQSTSKNTFFLLKNQGFPLRLKAPNSYDHRQKTASYSYQVQTDSLGGFELSFVLPPDAMGGDWLLMALKEVFPIKVEAYALPTFEVKLEYENLSLEGEVLSLVGLPMKELAVQVEITASGYPLQDTLLYTDEQGLFHLSVHDFNLSPNRKVFGFMVKVSVTDLHGETQQAQSWVPSPKAPLLARLKCALDPLSDSLFIDIRDYFGHKVAAAWKLQITPCFKGDSTSPKSSTFEGKANDSILILPLLEGRYQYVLWTYSPFDAQVDSIKSCFTRGYYGEEPTLFPRVTSDTFAFVFYHPNFKQKPLYLFYYIENREGKSKRGVLDIRELKSWRSLSLKEFSAYEDLSISYAYVQSGKIYSGNEYRKALPSPFPLVAEIQVPPLSKTRSPEQLSVRISQGGKGVSVPITLGLYDEALHSLSSPNWFNESSTLSLLPKPALPDFSWQISSFPVLWRSQEESHAQTFYRSLRGQSMDGQVMNTRMVVSPMASDLSIKEKGEEQQGEQNDFSIQEPKSPLRLSGKASVFFYPTLWSDSNGYLNLPFISPENPGRYFLQVCGYNAKLEAAYAQTSLISEQEDMLFWQTPRFVYEGDSLLLSCKYHRLNGQEAFQGKSRWQLGTEVLEKPWDWQKEQDRQSLVQPKIYKVPFLEKTPLDVSVAIENSLGQRLDGLQAQIPVFSQTQEVKESFPFCLFLGESHHFDLSKILASDFDTSLYLVSNPNLAIAQLAKDLKIDTNPQAYNALLLLLQNKLLGQKSQKVDYERLWNYLTPENAFCWTQGMPSDFYMTLRITEALASYTLSSSGPFLKTKLESILVFLNKKIKEDVKKKPLDSMPSAQVLRYLYTSSLIQKKRASDSGIFAMQQRFLRTFASTCEQYPLREGVYGLYALFLRGEDSLFNQVWDHYQKLSLYEKALGRYWKRESMGLSLGERLQTASLMYRLYRLQGHLQQAAEVNRWIWSQNRTSDFLSTWSFTRPIDILGLCYNSFLFPLPFLDSLPEPKVENVKNKLKITWPMPSGISIPDSIQAFCFKYGSLTLTQKMRLPQIVASLPDADLQIKTLGPKEVQVGDKIQWQVEITAKREFSYVQARLYHPAGARSTEPSGYQYRNTLNFYQDVQDAYTQWLIPFLPKGKYVLTYEFRAQTAGSYQTPPSSIESLFTPSDSFAGHSASGRIEIKSEK